MKSWARIILPVLFFIFLNGCASSGVSQEAEKQINTGYENAEALGNSSGGIAENYQNSTQMTKGALIGGATGAVAGGLTSGVGWGPGLVGGAIIGGAFGKYIDHYTTLKDRLENRNVKVIVLGDQILIVMLSSDVFNGMTPTIRPTAYSTLDLVSKYISSFANITVRVAAYTNETGTQYINRSLAQEQANAVVKYLWSTKINTRLLTAVGVGGKNLVEQNSVDWEKSENYRLEITLEKLPV